MKTIVAYESACGNPPAGLNIMVWPDSAMMRSGKPIFIPEEDEYFIHFALSARIKNVGKSIQPKFAHRYYDEIAPMGLVLNSRASAELNAHRDPMAKDIVADYSVVCGDFKSKSELKEDFGMVISLESLKDDEAFDLQVDLSNWHVKIDSAISRASERNTLKTGDLVASLLPYSIKASTDTLLKATLDKIDFQIKCKIK